MILRETLRRIIRDQLMWIDLDIADNEEMIHHDLDLEENATGKERITLSPFDLYNREVGDGNEKD